MNTPGIEFIREEMGWDESDPWNSVQSARFDLAEAFWHFTGLKIGSFEPSCHAVRGEVEPGSRVERLYGAMRDDLITFNSVYYWWNVLKRVYHLVIEAGRDY